MNCQMRTIRYCMFSHNSWLPRLSILRTSCHATSIPTSRCGSCSALVANILQCGPCHKDFWDATSNFASKIIKDHQRSSSIICCSTSSWHSQHRLHMESTKLKARRGVTSTRVATAAVVPPWWWLPSPRAVTVRPVWMPCWWAPPLCPVLLRWLPTQPSTRCHRRWAIRKREILWNLVNMIRNMVRKAEYGIRSQVRKRMKEVWLRTNYGFPK